MTIWKALTSSDQLDDIIAASHTKPQLILKHSTRCNVSYIAKLRLEDQWDFESSDLDAYLLDLLAYRELSDKVASLFQVYHESPQILIIEKGECTHDASHLDISVSEVHEVLA